MKKLSQPLLGILFGILCLLLATAVALALLHISDLLYRASLDVLDISEHSGYSRDVALRNYHDVMRYLSPFNNSEFHLTDLRYSIGGAEHFKDVKNIFIGVYIAGLVSLAGIAAISFLKRGKDKAFLRAGAVTTIVLPVLIAGAVAIDFNSMFVLFHKIFFSNDLWIFSPAHDEIIKILPEEFFMFCALFIVLLWIVAAFVQFCLYRRYNRRAKIVVRR